VSRETPTSSRRLDSLITRAMLADLKAGRRRDLPEFHDNGRPKKGSRPMRRCPPIGTLAANLRTFHQDTVHALAESPADQYVRLAHLLRFGNPNSLWPRHAVGTSAHPEQGSYRKLIPLAKNRARYFSRDKPTRQSGDCGQTSSFRLKWVTNGCADNMGGTSGVGRSSAMRVSTKATAVSSVGSGLPSPKVVAACAA
jgi:hypothetical protein